MFIRYIMKLMFSGTLPWSNPSLSAYQDKFNEVYSFLWYCLHGDDAVVMPVIIFNDWDTSILTFPTLQTNHDLGVLQNQIGAEALTVVIEYLPSQYDKCTLDSKLKRAAYITTLLNAKQCPFIWEYFHPGTIQIPCSEELYYALLLSYLQDCSKHHILEMLRPVPVNSHPLRLLNILHIIWDPDATPIWRPQMPSWCTCTCGSCSESETFFHHNFTHSFQVDVGISCTAVVTIHQVPINSPLQIGSEQQTCISRRSRTISLMITGQQSLMHFTSFKIPVCMRPRLKQEPHRRNMNHCSPLIPQPHLLHCWPHLLPLWPQPLHSWHTLW